MSRTQTAGQQARRRVAGAGPRPARRARRAVLRPGRRRPADRGRRGHPDRVRDHRADRHPGRVPGHRGDPGHVRHRVRGDDPAHHQRRRVLRVHLPRPGPRRGVAAALVALLAYIVPAGRPLRRVRPERRQPRPPPTWTCTRRGGRGRSAPGPSSPCWACCAWTSPAGSSASCCAPRSLVIVAETVAGLAHPAGGHLSFATLSPAALTSAGFGTFGVLAVVAVLGFVGFEQAPVLAEEARNARRTVPVATYVALGMIAVVYAGASAGRWPPTPAPATSWPPPGSKAPGCCSAWAAAACCRRPPSAPASPGSGCPQLRQPAATSQRRSPSISAR